MEEIISITGQKAEQANSEQITHINPSLEEVVQILEKEFNGKSILGFDLEDNNCSKALKIAFEDKSVLTVELSLQKGITFFKGTLQEK